MSEYNPPPQPEQTREPEQPRKPEMDKEQTQTELTVDLRATGMHKDELGIHKIELKAQKDRQWTKDSDIIGTVDRDGEGFGRLVLRESIWKKDDPLERRLVLKLFTMSDYWRGSIEYLQGESLLHSIAADEGVLSFVVVLNGSKSIARIRQIPQRKRLRGTIYALDMLDDDGNSRGFIIDDRRMAFGSDWEIKDLQDNTIGEIDGKILDLGGKFKVRIFDGTLANDKVFNTVLALFAAVLRYTDGLYNILRKVEEKVAEGAVLKLEDNEANLYQNPRRLRY
jgi:hypothetical protein